MPEPGTSDRGSRSSKTAAAAKTKKRGGDDTAGGGGGSASGAAPQSPPAAGGGLTFRSVPNAETPQKANKFAKLAGRLASKKSAEGKKDVVLIGAELEKAEVRR